MAKKKPKGNRYVHGMTGTRVWRIWCNMLSRCYNPRVPNFNLYGGREIYVLPRWHVFTAFFEDMGLPPSKTHTLERIDNNASYGPYNCRWATNQEQARNRRSNVLVALTESRSVTLVEACEIAGVTYATVQAERYKKGKSPKEALISAMLKNKRKNLLTTPR